MRGSKHVTLIPFAITFAAACAFVFISGCNNQAGTNSGKAAESPAGKEQAPAVQEQAPPPKPAKPQVVIETSMGSIVVELDPDRTPKTVSNFLRYVDDNFYDGLIFHRVKSDFMIQAGWLDTNLKERNPKYPQIVNESEHAAPNTAGTIAMARLPHPDSASSQFFINTVDNMNLNYAGPGTGYCVFGRVLEGMDVVNMIANVPTQKTDRSDWQPFENVVITTIRRK